MCSSGNKDNLASEMRATAGELFVLALEALFDAKELSDFLVIE
jgi:hypothetical protein